MLEAGRIPTATFRLQLNAEFTFRDLDVQVAYLRSLGVSDFYLSPLFTATPGSTHGYDVNDYSTVSPALGGREAFEQLADRLRAEGAGVLVDMVPNHMGIAGPGNAWWRDVMVWGKHSAYAPFFDIHWNAGGNRVLMPILAHHYGRELERGKISLAFEEGFFLRYGDMWLPVRPDSEAKILLSLSADPGLSAADREQTATFVVHFGTLAQSLTDENRDQARDCSHRLHDLQAQLARWVQSHPVVGASLERQLHELNGIPGEAGSFAALDGLIEEQHYRLARWKAGIHEINYRRFFAINSLVGLQMENPEVFRACHELLARFLREGRITGLRIDHIDGLRQPAEYLRRLQALERIPNAAPLYVLVEKILASPEEGLPADWPVHGTTGYDFISQLAGLLVDPAAEPRLTATYRRFTGETETYADAVQARKRLVLDELFAGAVTGLGAELAEIMTADWQWQDLTAHELSTAVRELMAALPVYRTYRESEAPVGNKDRAVLDAACHSAIARNPRLDPQPFEFVRNLLAGDYPPARAPAEFRQCLLDWVLSFQQHTGAVMAKAVEDTVFYTYCRLIALNEVGGSPANFGAPVRDFHAINLRRLRTAPHSLLTTSTHDTKFGEDTRSRLYALSEVADDWDRWVERWHELNRGHLTTTTAGVAPDRLDEYRFYQVLLGAWPLDPAEVNDPLRHRLRSHFRKAVEEAKRHTSSLRPNEPYLAACDRFAEKITSLASAGEFLAEFAPCAQRIARLGMMNSLTQLVLKCTVPGVPDFYQGNEIWEFSLVDPDNRRPVDYAIRHQLLAAMTGQPTAALLEHWRDGGIKLRVMQRLLEFRSAEPELFRRGDYRALAAQGTHADRVVAFLRHWEDRRLLVVVPRLSAIIGQPPLGLAWDNTALTPDEPGVSAWRDLLSGQIHHGTSFALGQLMAELPFAVLENINGKKKPDA